MASVRLFACLSYRLSVVRPDNSTSRN